MGQVSAASTILINAEPTATLDALADYETVRPKILSPHYSEYQVLEGGKGGHSRQVAAAGDAVACSRCAGERGRCRAHRHREGHEFVHGHQLDGRSRRTRFQRHGEDHLDRRGRGQGFLREDLAPLGLKKIQAEVLSNLKTELEGDA